MRNSVFSSSFPAAEFEKKSDSKEGQDFVLVSFERTEIDVVRETSETGKFSKPLVPMVRQTSVVALFGVPLN